MKKIVVATTNENKVKRIRMLLNGLDYEVLSLTDIGVNNIEEPKETGSTPMDIAIEKAIHYAQYLPYNTTVLSQDDTIIFEGVDEADNPGVHIKGPVIKKYGKFTDQLAANYYKELADKYGGSIPITFKYGHAIALRENQKRKNIKVVGAESELKARLVNKINRLDKTPGYFLSALIEVNKDKKWVSYNDLNEEDLVKLDSDLYDSITMLLKNI